MLKFLKAWSYTFFLLYLLPSWNGSPFPYWLFLLGINLFQCHIRAAQMTQMVKNPPATQEHHIQSLGWEDLLEKEMATHSSKKKKRKKRWEYQTALLASWEICMQVKKQQLEPDMEQQTGSKLGKEYIKTVYCHPAYRFLRRHIRWSGIPISRRIFHSLLWSTQSKAFV